MTKIRFNITVDEDVRDFINSLAESGRMERSTFINHHFAMLMGDAIEKGLYDKPGKPKKGKSQP